MTDLYCVDQSDCFISIAAIHTLCVPLWICVDQDLLLALADKGTLTILLSVEKRTFLITFCL